MSGVLHYRRVPTSIWTSLAGASDAAMVLALRLRTGPETTPIPGLVIAGRAGLAEALGWPTRRIEEAARELEQRGIATVDWAARLIWLPAAIAEAPPANPSVVVGWRSAWASVPACRLRETIRAALWTDVGGRGDAYQSALATAVGHQPNTVSTTVPDTVSVTVSPTVPHTVTDIGSGSGSGSGSRMGEEGGEAGSVPHPSTNTPSGDPHPDSDAAILDALRDGFRAARAHDHPAIDRDPDLATTIAALRPMGAEAIRELARIYYAADGQRRGDTYWRDRGWPLHLLASQAMSTLAGRAAGAVDPHCPYHRRPGSRGRAADRPLATCPECTRVASERRRDDERRREAEREVSRRRAELEALPALLRAWREAVDDIAEATNPRLAALLAMTARLDGDRLIVELSTRDLGKVAGLTERLRMALTRHAGRPVELVMTTAVETTAVEAAS